MEGALEEIKSCLGLDSWLAPEEVVDAAAADLRMMVDPSLPLLDRIGDVCQELGIDRPQVAVGETVILMTLPLRLASLLKRLHVLKGEGGAAE